MCFAVRSDASPEDRFSRRISANTLELKTLINNCCAVPFSSFRLDKRHEKKTQKDPKYTKRICRKVGSKKEVDPPNATPLWAISEEWSKEQQRLQQR